MTIKPSDHITLEELTTICELLEYVLIDLGDLSAVMLLAGPGRRVLVDYDPTVGVERGDLDRALRRLSKGEAPKPITTGGNQ